TGRRHAEVYRAQPDFIMSFSKAFSFFVRRLRAASYPTRFQVFQKMKYLLTTEQPQVIERLLRINPKK
ncbi:UNVERIFIED_CONTAM: hypothetical protein NY603_32675, partial [Bacteroidetes bacterium 56_B9]